MNKRFRETRLKFNLTQKEFAAVIGMKTSDIKLIEEGKKKPHHSALRVLKEKLGVDIDWLMNNADTENRR